ncbi:MULTISPECIES: P-loop NTPase fold protein [Microbacterium]|uniref:P-loop NTPase fold protein n=1 Tax=Microbacterium TaxID=33882 RepID=UPI0027D81053|nr:MULTISPECIES: P-loop NTPase fold protein [Microbacterium]
MAATAREGGWFVVDAPIKTADQDAFGHEDVADNLHRMVTEPTPHRRMVGLFGQFGVGKSTVIELLRAKLNGNKDLTLIRMSAERHEPVGFHRAAVYAFAEALVEAKEISNSTAQEVLEPLRSAQSTSFSDMTLSTVGRAVTQMQKALNVNWVKFWGILVGAVLLAALVLGLGAVLIPPAVWTGLGGFLTPLLTAGAFFAPFIWLASVIDLGPIDLRGIFTPGTRSFQRAKVEAADEQERAFAELVAKSKHRLIVAVDDIDRLSRDQILAALNAIRSFQLTCGRAKQPIFIVAIDEQIVRSAIEEDKEKTTPDAQEFLNRLFTLRQEVPVHETFDLRDYARDLLTERASLLAAKLGEAVEDVLLMLIHDDVRDPRHVVRLINAFSSDYRLAEAREARPGSRSIRAGVVTGHLDVLARMVVLKTDYPQFFRATLDDQGLITAASRASSLDLGDEEHQFLVAQGFGPGLPRHASLFRYLSRTAGWVEEGIDLTPFLYLGQDRFSLTLGNTQAREIRSALANNQPTALARLGNEAQAAGDAATNTFQELTVSVLRELETGEQSNGVAATLAAVRTCEALKGAKITRAVAPLVDKHPSWLTDVVGAIKLLENAEADAARSLATAVMSADSAASDPAIWENRSELESLTGEDKFAAWIERRIAAMMTWEQWRAWPTSVLDDQSANLMLARAVLLAARAEEDDPADESDLKRAREVSDLILVGAPVQDEEAMQKAVAQPANTYESAIGLLAAEKFALTDKQLAELSFTHVSRSIKGAGEDTSPLTAVMDGVASLARRTAEEAASWTSPDRKTKVAAIPADHLATWIGDAEYPPSRGVPVLQAMASHGVAGQTTLATALFSAWAADPNGSDNDDVSFRDSADRVIALIPQLQNPAQEAVVTTWISMLEDDSTLPEAMSLSSTILADTSPPLWADRALNALMMWFSTSYDFTGVYTDAAAAVMATGHVSPEVEESLWSRLYSVSSSGSVYRQRSFSTIAKLPWGEAILPTVTESVALYMSYVEPTSFWALFDMQQMHGQMNQQFVNRVDEMIEDEDDLTAARARVDALAGKLILDHAVTLVLGATSATAMEAVAARWADPSGGATAKDGANWLIRAAREGSSESKRMLAAAMAGADASAYAEVLDVLLDETVDLGNGAHADVWAFVTAPMTETARIALVSRIRPLLTEAQREAIAVAPTLNAAATDPAFDALVADDVREVMVHWIVDVPDASVVVAVAEAIRGSKRSHAEALAARRGRPKIPQRAVAYDAAMRVLRR